MGAVAIKAAPPPKAQEEPTEKPDDVLVPGLTVKRFIAIRAEIWAAPNECQAVLKRHGLSRLRWRVAERAWASHEG
jgi:hypothetical protein